MLNPDLLWFKIRHLRELETRINKHDTLFNDPLLDGIIDFLRIFSNQAYDSKEGSYEKDYEKTYLHNGRSAEFAQLYPSNCAINFKSWNLLI